MAKIAGCDLGNDSLKLVLGPGYHFTMANAVKEQFTGLKRKDLGFENVINRDISNIKLETLLNDLDVMIESKLVNGRFYVGPLAIRDGEDEVDPNTPKVQNDNLIIPLITMFALNLSSHLKKEIYNIIVGLPIKEYSRDREQFEAKLKGSYTITFLSGPLKDRVVEIVLEEVKALPEGVAVVMNQMINDSGTGLRNKNLQNESIGIIDIGAFTTDLAVVINGKPDSEASEGLKEGIAVYLDRLVEYINESFRVEMTRSQLVDHLEKKNLVFSVKGKMTDIRPEIEQMFSLFARRIVALVDKIWSRNLLITKFFVVGGGAKALRDYLITAMEKRELELTFIPDDEDPQLQNALGYWKYGKQKFGGRVA